MEARSTIPLRDTDCHAVALTDGLDSGSSCKEYLQRLPVGAPTNFTAEPAGRSKEYLQRSPTVEQIKGPPGGGKDYIQRHLVGTQTIFTGGPAGCGKEYLQRRLVGFQANLNGRPGDCGKDYLQRSLQSVTRQVAVRTTFELSIYTFMYL